MSHDLMRGYLACSTGEVASPAGGGGLDSYEDGLQTHTKIHIDRDALNRALCTPLASLSKRCPVSGEG